LKCFAARRFKSADLGVMSQSAGVYRGSGVDRVDGTFGTFDESGPKLPDQDVATIMSAGRLNMMQ
jgi:hypothetical protein